MMQTVEIAKYLGVGYRDIADSPRTFLDTVIIRMGEEAEYQRFLQNKNKRHG
jgi:hypothetical protein